MILILTKFMHYQCLQMSVPAFARQRGALRKVRDRLPHLARGSGFRVQGSGCRVQGAGCRVQGSGFGVQGSGFSVQGSGGRVQGAGGRFQGAGCRVQGSGFRVQDSGCTVHGARCKVGVYLAGRQLLGGVRGDRRLDLQTQIFPVMTCFNLTICNC